MNTNIHSNPILNQLPEAARDAAQTATATAKDVTGAVEDVAREVTNAAKDTANRATEKATAIYQTAVRNAEDTLASSKEYVRRNPVPVVFGAVAFGMAIGYMLVASRRKPTLGERYAEEPLAAMREAILGALTPVARRVHEGYDSARDGAGKIMDRVHGLNPRGSGDSIKDQIGRIGNNLKFW